MAACAGSSRAPSACPTPATEPTRGTGMCCPTASRRCWCTTPRTWRCSSCTTASSVPRSRTTCRPASARRLWSAPHSSTSPSPTRQPSCAARRTSRAAAAAAGAAAGAALRELVQACGVRRARVGLLAGWSAGGWAVAQRWRRCWREQQVLLLPGAPRGAACFGVAWPGRWRRLGLPLLLSQHVGALLLTSACNGPPCSRRMHGGVGRFSSKRGSSWQIPLAPERGGGG